MSIAQRLAGPKDGPDDRSSHIAGPVRTKVDCRGAPQFPHHKRKRTRHCVLSFWGCVGSVSAKKSTTAT